MMNLLCVSHTIDIINYGMLKAIQAKGFNTYVTYTTEDEHKAIPKDITGIEVPYFRKKFNWPTIQCIRKIIKTHQIHVIYAINSSDLSNALFATLGTQVKVVGYRGTQAKIRRSDLTYYLGTLNPRVAHMMCATQDIKEQLSKFISPAKMTVNPKPYDVNWMKDAFTHPQSVEGIPDDAFQVVCLANTKHRPFKGLRQLIAGMHLIEDPRVHLIHLGDYDEADYQLAQQGPAAARIHMLGLRKDAVHFLPGKDVCICPSIRDASPRSLREAMACKVACIVTDIPGARELVVDGQTGMIIRPDSPEAIAASIGTLARKNESIRRSRIPADHHPLYHGKIRTESDECFPASYR